MFRRQVYTRELLEASETAKQHVNLVSSSVFDPASRLEEHEVSLVFFLAPTAGFGDQKASLIKQIGIKLP